MGRLRAAWRLLAIAALTVSLYVLLLLGTILTLPFASLRIGWRDLCFRLWARSILRTLNARLEVRGRPPSPPFFLVTNHLSYIDVLVLASRIDAIFVAKSQVASWPIIGFLGRSVGTVFIDRNQNRDLRRVIAHLDRLLDAGRGVVLFPEGTSTRGIGVGPFRPSLLEAAARAHRPVSAASLSYRTPAGAEPAHMSVCWWGDMEFASHFWGLLALPGFTATLVFGEATIRDRDRKALAERLHEEVSRSFIPVVGPNDAPTFGDR